VGIEAASLDLDFDAGGRGQGSHGTAHSSSGGSG